MRTLAVDAGTRRVGLALSDEAGRLATPLEVLQVTGEEMALQAVARAARQHAAARLVVGLPLNMDDTTGPAARRAIAWGRHLGEITGLPVVFVDERLSSFQAREQLTGRRRRGEKLTRNSARRRLDALAAAVFLQDFLDGRLAPVEPA